MKSAQDNKRPDAAQGDTATGRPKQRSRTRAAIVAAAIRLLKSGAMPSMTDIAAAAEVSRRTVYLHFPTLEQLLLDARLGLLSDNAIEKAIDAADPQGDAEMRVIAMIRALCGSAQETLPLGRALIRLTVAAEGAQDPSVPRRGYRRIAWIEKAVEPLRDRLAPDEFDRLVSALAVVIGWEAIIVLQDIRGLRPDEQLAMMEWSACAIIRAALDKTSNQS